jgi:DNA-binding response OmpR family regulator
MPMRIFDPSKTARQSRRICTDFLESRGHVPDVSGDGVTGTARAITGGFDAIVLDLGLPGMDGTTLCRRLREDAHDERPC